MARTDNVTPSHLTEQFLPLLDQEEMTRYRRFHFDEDRYTYLAAHALVRLTLSRYAQCEPAQWRFTAGEKGKPEISPTAGIPPLHFNLSHTKGMVACVVVLGRECGVDVECARQMKDMRGIAEMVFSDIEVCYLNRQTEADWPQQFFKYWTLKEAYIKAIGQGLSAPLKKITFDTSSSTIHASYAEESLAQTGWQFDHWQPTATHHMSVAVKFDSATAQNANNIIYHELNLSDGLTSCQSSHRQMKKRS
jgi:4'-phosphopantetheinyl transferase